MYLITFDEASGLGVRVPLLCRSWGENFRSEKVDPSAAFGAESLLHYDSQWLGQCEVLKVGVHFQTSAGQL